MPHHPTLFRSRVLLYIGIIICAFAQINLAIDTSNMQISADEIEYDKEASRVMASENVLIKYKGYDIYTKQVLYDFNKEIMKFPYRFKLRREGQELVSEGLTYELKKSEGEADTLDAKIERLHIRGKKIIFKPNKIIIQDASFTTCESDEKHYTATAREIYLYPNLGFFVSFDNVMKTTYLPFSLWMPTYVYGSQSQMASSTPIPEMGATAREGGYIKQKYGYFFHEQSNGTLDIGYAQKAGAYLGFSHNVLIDESNNFNLRSHYYTNDKLEGAVEYNYDIIKPRKKSGENEIAQDIFSRFSPIGNLPPTRFKMLWQHREIIHESRISHMPKLQLEANNITLFDTGIFFNGKTFYSRVWEDRLNNPEVRANQSHFDGAIGRVFDLTQHVKFETQALVYGDKYSTGDTWKRIFGCFKFEIESNFLNPKISYLRKLYNDGQTPFEYEDIFARKYDEIGLELTQNFGNNMVGIQFDYEIERKGFRNMYYLAGFDMHCWRAIIKWDARFGQFNFGVDIY
jgi:hypothetical protein